MYVDGLSVTDANPVVLRDRQRPFSGRPEEYAADRALLVATLSLVLLISWPLVFHL